MIVLDANLLLYAYTARSPFHTSARAHLGRIFSDTSEPVGIPIQCVVTFLRVITNPVATGLRITAEEAITRVDEWRSLPHTRILYPGEEHWKFISSMIVRAHASGDVIADISIAALALEYGAVVHTNDRDFARFPGVRWHNPLAL